MHVHVMLRISLVIVAMTAMTSAALDTVIARVDLAVLRGRPVPPNLVSFSLEAAETLSWIGAAPAPAKPSFVNLIKQLTLTPQQDGPIFRIGGGTDSAWWNPTHKPKPPNIVYDITDTDLSSYTNFINATRCPFVIGLNFRRPNISTWAVEYAAAIDRLMPMSSIRAFEIGNEPDLYFRNGKRSSSYTYDDYQREWLQYARDIKRAFPNWNDKFIQGAVFGGASWTTDLATFMKNSVHLTTLSLHSYPTTHCNGNNVTIHELLDDHASQHAASFLLTNNIIPLVSSYNVSFVWGEGNSASCSGMPGVSNTFAATLWTIDMLVNVAAVNVTHFNFHGGGNTAYSALYYRNGHSDPTPIVQPLYYGLRMFAEATRDYLQLVNTTIIETSNPLIKIHSGYTTYNNTDNNYTINIIIIHKDYSIKTLANVTIIIPVHNNNNNNNNNRVYPSAELYRLEAPTITSEYDIRFAGQTYDGTHDGLPVGIRKVETVKPERGQYQVTMLPASAVLLRIPWGQWDINNSNDIITESLR